MDFPGGSITNVNVIVSNSALDMCSSNVVQGRVLKHLLANLYGGVVYQE